ncbi:MAG: hypothetical protein IPH06_10325 [Alphaproteobacteria bacterium]|jgi:hypothetical protein|nr:hypothetical protein [Alphaproteobacteria bacterium]QQS58380.1 MAG: hypothetical protein IPN28_06080 [Alphaproteobacteria bacterium]
MKSKTLLTYLFFGIFLFSPDVMAKKSRLYKDRDSQGYDAIFMPVLKDLAVTIDNDDIPPNEPNIIAIRFQQDKPPKGVVERIQRLTLGITTDMPPEYDVYGYEIRRYMAQVGNAKIYQDDEFLIEQIKNAKKARIIASFWQKHIEREIEDIEKFIEANDSSSSIRTAIRQARLDTRSFMIDLQGWLDSNERLLGHVLDIQGYIQFEYPEVIFIRPNERVEFFNFFQTRQHKLGEIRKYQPFAMMAY